MPHMAPLNGQLVAFDDTVEVHVSVNREGAELWLAKTEFNGPSTSPVFARVRTFPPNFSQYILLDTPGPVGALYTFRLFAAQSGSPSGDGLLIDELNIPRLKKDHGRKNYLTMCGEGVAQLSVMSGGTFIRGVIGSGSVVSRALLFGTETKPVWTDGLFPTADVQGTAKFLLSAASSDVGLIHVVELEDRRTDGWPDSDRMRPGAQLYYIALVWDSAGNFDFTWKTGPGLATTAGPSTNDPEMLTTKQRAVAIDVATLVCIDDSDDLSDGEATFTITVTPASPASAIIRTRSWKPMESGSSLALDEMFQVSGAAADSIAISVAAVEDDSGSFPEDSDDNAAGSIQVKFRSGVGAEDFQDFLTIDSGEGGDGFHFLAHCLVSVTHT